MKKPTYWMKQLEKVTWSFWEEEVPDVIKIIEKIQKDAAASKDKKSR